MAGSDVTRGQFGVIDRLEARGLVARTRRPNDRRSHALQLSPQGATCFRLLASKVRRHERRMAARLSARERRMLIGLLQRIG